MKNQKEIRSTKGTVRMQGEGEAPKKIRGYAAVFGEITHLFGDVYEVIDKGFFDDVLEQDVRILYNHDADNLLARTSSRTATIGVDDKGLWYELDPVDNHMGRGVVESISRGDLSQSSFGFIWKDFPEGYDYEYLDDGRVLRRLKKCETLFDVGPVTFPAYQGTEAGTRSLQTFRSVDKNKQTDEPPKTDKKEETPTPTETLKRHEKVLALLKES